MRGTTTIFRGTALFIAAVLSVLVAAPAEAATASKPPRSFFGMHYLSAGSGAWPSTAIGSLRLWDTGTTWPDIQPAAGVWDFSVLDAAVASAQSHGAAPMLVLGQSPRWASTKPDQTGAVYGLGAAATPKMADWTTYVRTVALRYKGKIRAYEIWNEADLAIFYQGTQAQLIALSKAAHQIIKSIDPGATVLSPSFTTRSPTQRREIYAYARAGGFRYADAISLHLYPVPEAGPESSMAVFKDIRTKLARVGVRKPVWNTELNYGMRWGGQSVAPTMSIAKQSAFVTRSYLLNWSNGVKRVYWYGWHAGTFASVQMAQADGSPAAPARAFATVARWMNGSMGACLRDGSGTYTCTIRYSRGKGHVKWNPSRNVKVSAPSYTTHRENMYGASTATRAGARLTIGSAPVLFRTTR